MQPMYKESNENKHRCRNCGGSLRNIYSDMHKCSFCGTEYRIYEGDKYDSYMQLNPASAPVLRACRAFSYESACYNGHDTVANYTKRDVLAMLAEALEPYVVFHEDFDSDVGTYKITGTIRVVEPDFRF